MKKILLLSVLVIFSCSGGDDSVYNNSSNYKLVDTINISWIDNETDPPTQYQDNLTYNYNGNKLLNITNGIYINKDGFFGGGDDRGETSAIGY